MRVCMVSYSFYESDTRIMQYANALAKRGDTVEVIALRRRKAPATEDINGVTVCRIQSRDVNEKGRLSYLVRILRFMLAATLAITRRHFARPYQIVHVHSVPDFLVFAAVIAKLLGARVILDIHDILPEFYASKFGITRESFLFKLLVFIERISIAFSDHVIIANGIWKERLLSRSVAPAKCTSIINYPDPELFVRQPKLSHNGKFVILYPGTLNRHQGVDIAVRSFGRVAHKMPDAVFHIYGEGPDKQRLIDLSRELGVSDRVQVHDFLPAKQIARVMANADLAVVPKRASSSFGNEAASTKIMEFMSVGVPVIVSRTNIDTLYHDESRVKFFQSENEEELAEAIYLLWSQPRLRQQLSESASAYIEGNSWTTRRLDYLALVDRLGASSAGHEKLVGSEN